jgi:small subunit ribosomal protein S8
MLTKVRNASNERKEKVDVPASKMKIEIIKILKNEGYIKNFKLLEDKKQGGIRIFLKYEADQTKTPVIRGLTRVSKPGLRKNTGKKEMPRLYNGMGTVIVSTSRGVLTDRKAREHGIGGEIVCCIW